MKRNVKKVVSYSKNFKDYVIYAVVRDGFSIASVCTQAGTDFNSRRQRFPLPLEVQSAAKVIVNR